MTTGWRPVTDVVVGATRIGRGLVPWRRATPRRVVRIARQVSADGLGLAGLARVAAIRNGPDVVLVDGSGAVTAEQLDRWSRTVAGELANRGILVPGGKLGVLCRSGRGLVVATIAATRLGADVIVLPPDARASSLAELLRAEQLRTIVHDDEFGDLLAAARHRGVSVLADASSPGVLSLRAMQALPQAPLARPRRPGRLAVVTSGVTARPRVARRAAAGAGAGVPLTTLVRGLGLTRATPMLIAAPLHQPFGLQFLALALGLGCAAITPDRPDPATVLRLLEEHGVRTLVAGPTLLAALADELGDQPLPASLTTIVAGGGPLLAARAQRIIAAFGPIVHHVYGSAEAGWCTLATPADLAVAPGTVGRPAAGIELALVDDGGRPVPVGGIGRLLVRSPMAADGLADANGMIDTGDLAHRDRDGRYFVDGRAAERVRRHAVDLFPDAIEDALLAHPSVADAMVAATADATRAEVVLRPGALPPPTADLVADLAARVADRLGPAAVPIEIRVVATIAGTERGRRRRVFTEG